MRRYRAYHAGTAENPALNMQLGEYVAAEAQMRAPAEPIGGNPAISG